LKIIRHVDEGTITPWYYGHIYFDWRTNRSVKCLIPVHLPLRLWHYLALKWRRLNNEPSKIDIMVSEMLNNLERKWEEKFREELDAAIVVVKKQLLKQLKETNDA